MICICNANPEGFREFIEIDSISSTSGINTKTGLIYSYQSRPILLRWRDFYQCLKMTQRSNGTPIVTSNHRISYTLDLQLEEDWRTLAAIQDTGNLQGITAGTDGTSMEEAASRQSRLTGYTAFNPLSPVTSPTDRYT